jgi:hypothetical protein
LSRCEKRLQTVARYQAWQRTLKCGIKSQKETTMRFALCEAPTGRRNPHDEEGGAHLGADDVGDMAQQFRTGV